MEKQNKHKYDGKEDRNYHQKPFDENTDPLPQIDPKSAELAEQPTLEKNPEEETDTASSKRDEINQTDLRDQGDSSRDWDAENNRTSRPR